MLSSGCPCPRIPARQLGSKRVLLAVPRRPCEPCIFSDPASPSPSEHGLSSIAHRTVSGLSVVRIGQRSLSSSSFLEACGYSLVLLNMNHFALNSELWYGGYFDSHLFDLGPFLLDRVFPELHLLLKSEHSQPRVPGCFLHLLVDLVKVCG